MYDFICIDFETANTNKNSACAVGICAVENMQITKSEGFLIKPPTTNFNPRNVSIHGITYDMVKNCNDFKSIWENHLLGYFQNSLFVIAHNAPFDMSVLRACLNEYQTTCEDFLYLDSMNIGWECSGHQTGGKSLAAMAKYYAIDFPNHHEACCDALTAAEIVIKAIQAFSCPNLIWTVALHYNIVACRFSQVEYKHNPPTNKSSIFPKAINIHELSPTTTAFDVAHPLYQKNCVLTGELKTFERKDAMQKILDVGGIVKSAVSSKTDYLIVGIQDKKLVGDDGLSSKEEKAYSLIEKGIQIKIIKPELFME